MHSRLSVVCVFACLHCAYAIAIKFAGCDRPDWICVDNSTERVIYTCNRNDNESLLHLADFYAEQSIKCVTVQRCARLKVIIDCLPLAKPSQLERLQVKNCDKLEFISLANSLEVQTPAEVTIDNVKEIVALTNGVFQMPTSNNKAKCYGKNAPRKIVIRNSKINYIASKAIVGEVEFFDLQNVTVNEIHNNAVQISSLKNESTFKITDSTINKFDSHSITVATAKVLISNCSLGDILVNAINITADSTVLSKNNFRLITSSGFIFTSTNTEISHNHINTLKSNALSKVKCLRTSKEAKFSFLNNKIENVEPYSLYFDYDSCKSAGTLVHIVGNQIDCRCRNIDFLCSSTSNKELYSLILNTTNNNTCLSAPCLLPIDIVKLLSDNEMCQLNLDPRVMCLLYNDKKSSQIEVTTGETDTEPSPTLYLVRQANTPKGGSAAMTAIDKDDLLKDTHLNMTNRTTIKIVFDSSKDFVETLRSTSSSRRKSVESPKPQISEVAYRCVGTQCKSKFARDRQKALDFYKYVYAQLRTPKVNESKRKKF